MAKKKSKGVNKSQAIRDYLTEHPDATASVIRPALAERGIDVSVALIGQIKQWMKKSGGKATKKKAAKKTPAGKQAAPRESVSAKTLTAEDLVDAKKLVDELGGIDQARKALEYLEELG
jgi:hypothetical protein